MPLKHLCAIVTSILLTATMLSADDAVQTSASSKIVVPPLSGKLGQPVQIFNGKDLSGWVWIQKPPKAGAMAPEKKIDEV